MTTQTCDVCGAAKETFDLLRGGEKVGAEIVCPNEWRHGPKETLDK
jgi:hypothetical protein